MAKAIPRRYVRARVQWEKGVAELARFARFEMRELAPAGRVTCRFIRARLESCARASEQLPPRAL